MTNKDKARAIKTEGTDACIAKIAANILWLLATGARTWKWVRPINNCWPGPAGPRRRCRATSQPYRGPSKRTRARREARGNYGHNYRYD